MRLKFWSIISCLIWAGCSPSNFYLTEDNDYLKPDKNRDTNYSQGLEVGYSSRQEGIRRRAGLRHEIYTPENLRASEVETGDRGYAGTLAGFYQYDLLHEDSYSTFRISGGCTGPCAHAEDLQKFVHNDLGLGTDPQGWGNQYPQEAFTEILDTSYSRWLGTSNFDLLAGRTARIGTLRTYGETELIARWGWSLPAELAPVEPLDSSGNTFFFFGGLLLRTLAYDALIQGSVFRDDGDYPTHDPNYVHGGLKLGFAFKISAFSFQYTWLRQSSEWEGQEPHSYGSISLGVSW